MTDAPRTQHDVRRGDIQGLRAIAVGVVLLSHLGVAGFAGGYVGVDVFFVVSGFLITGILAREVVATGRVSVLDFYARRARRILPAASVTLLGIVIASWIAFGYIRLAQVLNDVVWAGLFAANIDFARTGSDYFAADGFVSPVQHFWSLAVEEQFYLLWPVLIAGVMLTRPKRTLRALALTLLAVCALSFTWSVLRTSAEPTSAYYSTLTRGWELGAGALLALGIRYVRMLTRGFLTVLSWTGLALIVWSTLTYSASTPFPGSAALVPVLGSLFVLAGGIRPTPYGAAALLDRAPMRRLGDISYSLYLVHWPVFMIPAMVSPTELTPFDKLTLLLLSLTLATLMYHCVETPFRTSDLLARRRSFALGLWPAAASLVLLVVTAVGTQTTTVAYTAAQPVVDPQQAATPQPNLTLAVERAASRSKSRAPLPAALTPSPLKLRQDNWHLPTRCVATVEATRHTICTLGDPKATRTLVLLGDSHIGMWTDPIVALAKSRGWKVNVFLKVGCPPIDVRMWRNDRDAPYGECSRWRTWAYAAIARIKPDRIVTTGYTQAPLENPKTREHLDPAAVRTGTALLGPGMRSTLAKLTRITPNVTVLSDTTTLPEQPADCLGAKHATLRTCAVAMNRTTVSRNAVWRQATLAARARWVNVDRWLCAKGVCPLVIGNVIVYTDQHHLTRTFARTLIPQLQGALKL